MRIKPIILAACAALTLAASGPAAGQAPAPAAAPPLANPFRDLWTSWSGASRDSLNAEAQAGPEAEPAPSMPGTSIPAVSALVSRSRQDAEALGARVGEVVRGGDCEEGERIARAAGDFPLVQAVRDYCARRAAGP
jgi:hypothetical protein